MNKPKTPTPLDRPTGEPDAIGQNNEYLPPLDDSAVKRAMDRRNFTDEESGGGSSDVTKHRLSARATLEFAMLKLGQQQNQSLRPPIRNIQQQPRNPSNSQNPSKVTNSQSLREGRIKDKTLKLAAFARAKLQVDAWLDELKKQYSPLCDNLILKSEIGQFSDQDQQWDYALLHICLGNSPIVSYGYPLYSLPIVPPGDEFPVTQEHFLEDFNKVHELQQKVMTMQNWLTQIMGGKNFQTIIDGQRDNNGNAYFNITLHRPPDITLQYSYAGFADDVLLLPFDDPPCSPEAMRADLFKAIGDKWLNNNYISPNSAPWSLNKIEHEFGDGQKHLILELLYNQEWVTHFLIDPGTTKHNSGSKIMPFPANEELFLVLAGKLIVTRWINTFCEQTPNVPLKAAVSRFGTNESSIPILNVIFQDIVILSFAIRPTDLSPQNNIVEIPLTYDFFLSKVMGGLQNILR